MSAPDRLYGTPGAEHLYDSIAEVWESKIDPHRIEEDSSWTVEEFTVQDPIIYVPSVDDILDWIIDSTADNVGSEDDPFNGERHPLPKADMAALVEPVRLAIADAVTYHWADTKVAEHTITLDLAGEPLLDGGPLYVPSGGVS